MSDDQGARVWFRDGEVELSPPRTHPAGTWRAAVSVVSPGTELRALRATRRGPDRPAGYMTIARTADGAVMAPVPHGAWVRPDQPGLVRAAADVRVAAVSRFQLMAALGLADLPITGEPVVVGTGPVALGCVLELVRRGVPAVTVLSNRRESALSRLPGVRTVSQLAPDSAPLVVDATGRRLADALGALAPRGMLGLLGTPDPDVPLSSLTLHRKGARLIGMHELAGLDPERYQRTYTEVTGWLREWSDDSLLETWCLTVPGEKAAELYGRLEGPDRPAEPVLLLDWDG